MSVKKALTGELASQRRRAGKNENPKMLDVFVRQTGCNRKYALHMLTRWGRRPLELNRRKELIRRNHKPDC